MSVKKITYFGVTKQSQNIETGEGWERVKNMGSLAKHKEKTLVSQGGAKA